MPTRPANILMLAIDSLRRDHMSCYGYPRLTTPHMDRIASRGVLFENSFSAYIPTTPGYSSMLTGRDVFSTGQVGLTPHSPLHSDQPTLPEVLREAGYGSLCIGFGDWYRGFDKYADYEAWVSWEDRPARKAENLNAIALPALDEMAKSGQPFLLFMRHMDPHSPYLPPAPFDRMFYTKDPCDPAVNTIQPVWDFKPFADFFKSWMPPGITDIDYVTAAYDGEVAYMDACIAQLFNRLEELGIADNTLIMINSDHGETLNDHGIYFDHHGLYEATLRVPLIFCWPGHLPEGRRLQQYTLLQDHMPTLLDIVGLKKQAKQLKLDGRSLLPFIRGEEQRLISEFYITECTWMRKRGWRTPQWKFFEALEPDFHNKPPMELYNLIEDPEEGNNLAAKEPALVKYFQNRIQKWVAKRTKETGKSDPILDYEIGTDKYIGGIATAKNLQKR
jgi:arylsulfatase A-like enzyme